jgi:hypothetical protein
MKHVFGTLTVAALMSACSPHPSTAQPASPTAGGDKDAHGCLASAGYTWSPLRAACIRIFETGVAFAPSDDNPDQTLQAFVVMPLPANTPPQEAELYLPGQSAPMPLQAVRVPEGETQPVVLQNKAAGVEIEYVRDDYLLRLQGKLVFVRHGQDNAPLDALLGNR